MLTLEVTRGLDDIYTGEKKRLQFLYEAQIDFTNGLISRLFLFCFKGRSSKTRWTRHINQSDLRFIADSEFSLYVNTAGLPYLRELLYDSEHCKHFEIIKQSNQSFNRCFNQQGQQAMSRVRDINNLR